MPSCKEVLYPVNKAQRTERYVENKIELNKAENFKISVSIDNETNRASTRTSEEKKWNEKQRKKKSVQEPQLTRKKFENSKAQNPPTFPTTAPLPTLALTPTTLPSPTSLASTLASLSTTTPLPTFTPPAPPAPPIRSTIPTTALSHTTLPSPIHTGP
ncbi:hypothetical protein MMC09_005190 [Bachmanniomyces sp. S44760]|nr:hypothetical protein [Bachmanniomyces sp. S44760]